MVKRRILVVDDDEAVRAVTREMLDRLGYDTSTAASGESALEQNGQQPFDLILLDLTMPTMSGQEVYGQLRDNDVSMRVVFMTGYAPESLGDLLVDGVTAVLSKPFRFQDLKSTVENMLA